MPNILQRIDEVVSGRHLLHHPFYKAWVCGQLPKEALENYAREYWPHILAFPTYVSAAHSQATDMESRRSLLMNLLEEESGDDNHPELWLRFAEGIGVSRDEVKRGPVLPSSSRLVDTFRRLTRESGFPASIAALLAYEGQVPEISAAKIDGLRSHYGIDDERTLAFWEVHKEADVQHREEERTVLARAVKTRDDERAALAAATEAADALWSFLDGVHQRWVQ